MIRGTAILIVLAAATLEAVGDAVVRIGIHTNAWYRYAISTAAAVILFVYGWTVNAPL